MKAEFINPFLSASTEILMQVCNTTIQKKPLFIKQGMTKLKNVTISIGIFGDVQGNLILNLDKKTALDIASKMMGGYPVSELDEITTSAVSELGNMIAGHSGMYFSNENKKIDITPPTVTINSDISKINYMYQAICVPLLFDNGNEIEIDISIL